MSITSVDVVVVTTNRRDIVLECLRHLDDPIIRAVIVVVNASVDGTAEAIRSAFPHVTVVELAQTASLPETNNRGAERATSDFVLFMNDDVVAAENAVASLAQAASEAPDVVAAGGRLVDPTTLETQPQYRPRTFPTLLTFALTLLDIERFWPGNPITRRHWGGDFDDETTTDAEQPAGACLLVRRSTLERIGGFDERYWVWYEDTDLLRRLADHGRILYVPTAVFRHLGGSSVGSWKQADVVRSRYQGILRYGEAHFSAASRIGLASLAITAALPRAVVFRQTRPDVCVAYRAITRAAIALLRGRDVPQLVSEHEHDAVRDAFDRT